MEYICSIDILIVALYLLIVFLVGMIAGRNVKNLNEYAVAGRSYRSLVLFATLSASFIGGGYSSGNAAKVFSGGIGFAITLWGFSVALFFISMKLAPKMDNFQHCISVGDIMGINLGKRGRIIAGILGCVLCTGVLAAQVGAMGAVFSTYTSLTSAQGILLGCGIVIIYTTFGGMHSVVLTDVVQFTVLVIMVPLSLWIGLQELGGIEVFLTKIPLEHTQIFNDELTPALFIGLFLSFLVGESLSPPYIQRLLAGHNASITSRGVFFSALLSIPFFLVTGAIGLLALAVSPTMDANEAMPYILKVILPIGLRGLAIAAVVSIVMSSADSFLNSAVICLIRDVAEPIFGPKLTEHPLRELSIARLLSLSIGISSVIIAMSIPNVMDILLFSYQFYAPVIVAPLVMTLLGKSFSWGTFVIGAFCGSVSVIIMLIGGGEHAASVHSIVVGTVVGVSAFFVSYWFEQYVAERKEVTT